jgi:hypothetical protein
MTKAEQTAKITELTEKLHQYKSESARYEREARLARGAERRRLYDESARNGGNARWAQQQLNIVQATRTVD